MTLVTQKSIDQKAQLQKMLAARVLARRRLLHFTQMTHPSYSAGWVHDDICRRLEKFSREVTERKSPRLMLLMPPRHGKSELASIRFPAWHLGHNPTHELINVGYNMDLPMKFSRKVRELMRDPQYQAIFPGAILNQDSQAAEEWSLQAGGGFLAAGVGGGITGKGAHVLIIDDPIKNQEEADSALVRDRLWEWYQSTAYTRLAPGGGVLVIECMVGETLVLMADGTERRLDKIRAGDVIATYENGQLTSTTVAKQRSSGSDQIYKIMTKSGKILRANGRHPFLAATPEGELKWVRARSLSTANKIVAVRGSEESGQEWSALRKGVMTQLSAEAFALSTTLEKSGLTDTAHRPTTQLTSALDISSTGMASPPLTTPASWKHKTASVLSVEKTAASLVTQNDGSTRLLSTIVMPPVKSAGCSVTAATQELDIFELSPSHLPLRDTSDFTLDEVVSVELDGVEEVFDVQVDRTTNFIANGVVSSNTWWNDDDLAGRIQLAMAENPDADQFEIIKYPALSEAWEYRDNITGVIYRFPEEVDTTNPPLGVSNQLQLLRPKDFCLHEDRYPVDALHRIKHTLYPRIWSALFQQNPVPDEGMYFQKQWFKSQRGFPMTYGLRIYTAWDFAISEKQQNDWTVGVTILQDENDVLYVLDVVRFKGDSFVIVEAILDAAHRWGSLPGVGYLIGAEDGQIWRSIEPLVKKRMTERKQYPSYEALRPMTDKVARARALQGRMQQGRVVFPHEAPWLAQAQQELLRFPAGVHDDVVDAMAWAAQLCLGKSPPRLLEAPTLASWRDKLELDNSGASHMAA